jgi:hypothetical protein
MSNRSSGAIAALGESSSCAVAATAKVGLRDRNPRRVGVAPRQDVEIGAVVVLVGDDERAFDAATPGAQSDTAGPVEARVIGVSGAPAVE